MPSLSTDWIFKFLLHEWTRRGVALAAGASVWHLLSAHAWPWWAWLPAAILAVMAGYSLMILLTYAYQKSTYQIRARLIKEQLHRLPADEQRLSK